MKQSFKISILALTCAGIFGLAACSKALDNLADLNKNENQPLTASASTLLTAAEFSGVMLDQGSFVTAGDGDGFLGIFNQHFAGNHAEGVQFNTYVVKHKDFQFLFNDAYVSSLKNLQLLIKNAKPGDKTYVGIAQVLQAYQLGYLTSVYGDIPWTQALDIDKFPHAKYDAQTDIYATVQNLLSTGIGNMKAGGDIGDGKRGPTGGGDIIYGGLSDKWIAAAYLLKARFYNHMSKKDPAGSATAALQAVDSAKLAGMASEEDDFVLPYDGASSSTVNPWVGMWNNSMLVASKPFLTAMMAQNDPRINAYFTSTNFNNVNVYGLSKTIDGVVGSGNYMYIGPDDYSYFGQATSNVLLATYPELLMIEAEAALRSGNAARAATAHNKAITTQLNAVVTLTADKALIPAYVATYASETAGTITLEKIMTEKHKLMFTLEAESWMDVRRTDYKYPSWLTIPVLDASAATPVPAAASFIQRLLYPQSELDKNAANVPNATLFDKLPILK